MSDCMYVLEEQKDMMFDFFALLASLYESDRYRDLCARNDYKYNTKIADSYYRLALANKKWNNGFSMFFIRHKDRDINLFDWLFRANIDRYSSSEDLINAIDEVTENTFIYSALRFYDCHNNFTEKFYDDLISKSAVFMSYMNGLDTTTQVRWEIMSLVQSPEDVIDAFKAYIKNMYREFTLEYASLMQQRNEIRDEIEGRISDATIDTAILEYEAKLNNESDVKIQLLSDTILPPTHEARVVALMFAPCRIERVESLRRTYYTVGTGYMEYFDRIMDEKGSQIELKNIFKAFTDPTRSQIIDILHEKECYNGELSKLLGVPMSSLTHHMDILNNSGFVIKRTDGKRTYYQINRNQFLYAANLLRRYVENNED